MAETHVLGPIPLRVPAKLTRADLELYGVDHFCPSYVAQVFFNDADLEADTAGPDSPSYAGRFAIFGHQRCAGDEGHCEVHEHLRRFDDRPSHPLTRAFKRVVVTDAVLRQRDASELTITLVVTADPEEIAGRSEVLLNFRGAQLTMFT